MVVQHVRPRTKHYARLYILAGAGGLLASFLLQRHGMPLPLQLLAASFCLVLLALGVSKQIEPAVSLEITPKAIRYYHTKGNWTLGWDNLQRFGIPQVQHPTRAIELAFLGLRLRHYDEFLQQLSPRLAVHLLQQQRALMAQVIRTEMPPHRQHLEYFEVPDYFTSDTGQRYSGVLATFATRMVLMREMLGFDLYLPQNALDRPLPEFIRYLKELQATRIQHLD